MNEFVLANLLLLDAVQLLEYLCIWIVDTAVMVHMAPYAVGMVHNAYENLNGQAITISNGIHEIKSTHDPIIGEMAHKNMKGDARGTMMIKKGNELVFIILVWINTGLVYCLYINQISNDLAFYFISSRKP